MVRHKVLPFLLVVGLVSLLIPLTIALAQGDGGTVSIMDSDPNDFSGTLSDQAMIELTSLPALGADKAYEGWLVNSETGRLQSTGVLALDSNGNVSATFSLRSGDNPSGENLVAAFDTFVLSVEPVPDPKPAEPSADKPYKHAIPAGGLAHIRHLLYSWQGNPEYTSGSHAGTPKGISVGLREQTWTALVHSRLSVESNDLADVHAHACHVVNIIEGSAGPNFDATCGNPGDDFGVLNYAPDAKHAGFAASAAPEDAVIGKNHRQVIASADEVATWAGQARDQALFAIGANSIGGAKLFVRNAEDRLVKSLNSAKGSYTAAQAMAMYTLTAAAPGEIAPPDSGDPNVPNVALGVLVAGAVLLLGGAFIFRRSRSRANAT